MLKISKRLCTVAQYVRDGAVVADIGTDHAYLPIYLAEQGKIKRAVASDINKGPLEKAKENIQQYIINNFTPESYTDENITGFKNVATFILKTFRAEKYSCTADYGYYKCNEYFAFADWCAGLPSLLDTCYYYNRSATADVAKILEQTESESGKYSESESEQLLTMLIYRELKRGESK
jgi:hypothetical protein